MALLEEPYAPMDRQERPRAEFITHAWRYHTHTRHGWGLEDGSVVRATGSFPSTQVVA